MKYFKEYGKYYIFCVSVIFGFNLYFVFLVPGTDSKYLYYIDFLMLLFAALFAGSSYMSYRKKEKEKKRLLVTDGLIYDLLGGIRDREVMEHDITILQNQLDARFDENCELQDYVAKWCHEIKIPLSAAMLINEDTKDAEQKKRITQELERMNVSLNSLLLGCKLQSSLFDLQIRRVDLKECVKTSIKNNQYFLIQNHFQIDVDIEESTVYSDPAWIVYVLDQLIANAIKYKKDAPKLKIYTEKEDKRLKLFVRDNGEGIKESDIRRVFEKGYVGSNYHNGKYKSTGMGLYMVANILEKLEHEIYVESEYGEYTQFCINFNL